MTWAFRLSGQAILLLFFLCLCGCGPQWHPASLSRYLAKQRSYRSQDEYEGLLWHHTRCESDPLHRSPASVFCNFATDSTGRVYQPWVVVAYQAQTNFHPKNLRAEAMGRQYRISIDHRRRLNPDKWPAKTHAAELLFDRHVFQLVEDLIQDPKAHIWLEAEKQKQAIRFRPLHRQCLQEFLLLYRAAGGQFPKSWKND